MRLEDDRVARKVVPGEREVHAFTRQGRHVHRRPRNHLRLLAGGARLQHLIDGAVQAVGVGEHHVIEPAPLLVAERARLQRLEIQTNRRDGRLQLVGDGVDEGVVFLVPADFQDEEHGVDDEARDDQAEGDDAEDEDADPRAFRGDDDPADVQ